MSESGSEEDRVGAVLAGRWPVLAAATLFGVVAILSVVVIRTLEARTVWDHFDVVRPGTLYRSGRLTAEQMEDAVRRLGLRTIVSFLRDAPEVRAERALAARLGVDFLSLPMPGDGFGQEEQFREVLAACEDPARRPVLVHCARGTCRTGASVALFRYEKQGWTIEDVGAEMRRQTYRQGFLPGYVYTMVKDRPFDELYHPRMTFDPAGRDGAEGNRHVD